jgi:hypothetical protein
VRSVPHAEAEVTVRPRLFEWISIGLWPIACFYAAYILLSIALGVPDSPGDPAWADVWRRTIVAGTGLSVVVIAWSIQSQLARGYWRVDGRGITRGKIAILHVPWSEIEALVIGMPDEQHWWVGMTQHLRTSEVEASVSSIQAYRDAALVLRLRGKRLFVVSLLGRQHVNGEALMQRIVDRCADRLASTETYTATERKALARVRFTRILHTAR